MGKFSLVYVMGLGLLVAYSIWNINATGTSALDTYSTYFGHTMVHNIATAGANIGTQMLLHDPATVTDISNADFANGMYSVHFDMMGDSAVITASSSMTVTNTTLYDTVIAGFRHTPFSKYGWFTESEVNGYVGGPYYGASDWKITGDSVFGLAHTNRHFNLGGAPYFNDKVTATTAPALMTVSGVQDPIYKAGYEWGISVNRPIANLTNLESIALSSSALIDVNKDVSLDFFSDGTVHVRIPPNGADRDDTVSMASLAPQGVVVVKNGDLRIKGTYSGQVTVVALQGTTTNKGNVWLDGNGIIAADDPRFNPNSTDMMGIVSERNTFITRDDSRTTSSNFIIEAVVYCYNGELTAEQFWMLALQGRVTLYGGVTQKTAGSLGVFSGGGLLHGMYYSIHHDPRFNYSSPPHYPVSDKYELVTWWEN